jgi:hypothetical protein
MPAKILIRLFLVAACNSVQGIEEINFDYNGDFTPVEEYYSEARFLNVSLDGIFNNSLLTVAGIFIVGVILFGKYFLQSLKSNHHIL